MKNNCCDEFISKRGLTFGRALDHVKSGGRAFREGWNGKGMYIFVADDIGFHTNADISEFSGLENGVCVQPMLVLRTARGELQPGWLATQSDMLSEDWCIDE